MKDHLSRRDFLKLIGVLPLSYALPRPLRTLSPLASSRQDKPKNVLVIVFDALSAFDVSVYGFNRKTTPNIDRLSARAIIYRNHFAGGNFTTPGTASLLTGVLPWTHRAINLNGTVADSFVAQNIFSAFHDYYRIAYTHNGLVSTLLRQFSDHVDELIPKERYYLESSYDMFLSNLFRNDSDIFSVSWVRNMQVDENGYAYSLYLSHLNEYLQEKKLESLNPLFPRGLPTYDLVHSFLLETAIDNLGKRLTSIPRPFLGYFHFMPPHAPYRAPLRFCNVFQGDGFRPPIKPISIFAKKTNNDLPEDRRKYDEYILYCDQEFGKLYNYLESSGLLENTWLVLTSDHGEMFERGIEGHGSEVLYQPVVRIPLMIFEPGREIGMIINAPTNAIDILQTLTYLTGQNNPDWAEGMVLPPFAVTNPDSSRNLYTVQARNNGKYASLTQASITLVKDNYKLHYYFGYPQTPEKGFAQLFDLGSDPEEMTDLYLSKKETASELFQELEQKLAEVNKPYL